jgi:hypothetical protein
MTDIVSQLGVSAIIAVTLYAAALAGLVEVAKRWARRGVAAGGRRATVGSALLERVHALVALLGAATGPVVWPWLMPQLVPDAPPLPLATAALLGVGAAGLAHLLYPLVLERVLEHLGMGRST